MKFVKADFTDIEEISKLYDDVCDYLCTHENYPGWKKGVYPTKDDAESNGLLKHGTYYYAGNLGIDECCIWGDYFYMEALMRFLNPDWKKYW